jgi:autotransporter-associated beta strand protein
MNRTLFAALVSSLALSTPVFAQATYTWDASQSHNWNLTDNNSPNSGKNWTVNSAEGNVWVNASPANNALFISTAAGDIGDINVSDNIFAGKVTFSVNGYRLVGTSILNLSTFNVASGVTATVNNPTASSGLTKSGAGTLILGNSTNAYNALVGLAVSAGTVALGGTNALQMSGIVTLTGVTGSTLSSGTTTGFSSSVQALSVSGNPTIALGTGSHTLTIGQFTAAAQFNSLTITGWQGTAGSSGTAGKLVFTGDTSALVAQLGNISFSGYGTGAVLLGTGELVPAPVPEPAAALGVAAAGLARFRRCRRVV